MKSMLIKMIGIAALLVTAACHPGEGERCNPLFFGDECTAGDPNLSCVYPPGCGVAFFCPKSGSSNPNCAACPTGDMSLPPASD
jgi:hypothetical protein